MQALQSVEQIEKVHYVECSFPSVPSEVPRTTRGTRARFPLHLPPPSPVLRCPTQHSHPSHSQAPYIQLERWTSLDESEWSVRWAPSWSVQATLFLAAIPSPLEALPQLKPSFLHSLLTMSLCS